MTVDHLPEDFDEPPITGSFKSGHDPSGHGEVLPLLTIEQRAIIRDLGAVCLTRDVALDSQDPTDAPQLTRAVHVFVADTTRKKIARYREKHVETNGPIRLVIAHEARVDKAIQAYYDQFGTKPAEHPDSVIETRRQRYLKENMARAWGRAAIYPEVAFTSTVMYALEDARHTVATHAATILLASYGKSFEHLPTSPPPRRQYHRVHHFDPDSVEYYRRES